MGDVVAEAAGGELAAKHVAVVYFHGMGSQRRYEETSRLIDALDKYVGESWRRRGEDRGILMDIKPRTERARTGEGGTYTYIRARHMRRGVRGATARFYEVYWAPLMAEGTSAKSVLRWMLGAIIRPVWILFSRWRLRQRVRRAGLMALRDWQRLWGGRWDEADFDKVLQAYATFEGLSAERAAPKGRFREFLRHLQHKMRGEPRHLALARWWRRVCIMRELWSFFLLLTLGLALLGGVLFGIGLVLMLLEGLAAMGMTAWLDNAGLTTLGALLEPGWKNGGMLLLYLAGALGLTRFLTDYMSDVQQWCTYEETDTKHRQRAAVIAQGMETLAHVLKDPLCERVVLVAHSLGTAVAHDTLLALQKQNHATAAADPAAAVPLEKIEHLVTVGSPIDKIHYLFESFRSDSHRYRRVVEALRGDIGTAPFSRERRPHIHWVNYWDRGDVVSGVLRSPTNEKSVELRVDNVQLRHFHFPDPWGSHIAYFRHRQVVGDLFAMIYERAHSFVAPEGDTPGRFLGPGQGALVPNLYLAVALAVPYLGIWHVVQLIQRPAAAPSYTLIGTAIGILLAGALISRLRGHLDPL